MISEIIGVFFAAVVVALGLMLFVYLRKILVELKKLVGIVQVAYYDKLIQAKKKFAEEKERQVRDQIHDIR